MAKEYNKGLALGMVLAYFLGGYLAKITGGLTTWIVLAIAAYFAFFAK